MVGKIGYLTLGLLFVVLAFTVFAHASTQLTCNNAFDCSVAGYCEPNGVPGYDMYMGHCGVGGNEPCSFPFSVAAPGNYSCKVTMQTTGYGNSPGNALQNNEIIHVYLNDTLFGTTQDLHANTGDPANTTFCGIDTQVLTGNMTFTSASNTITFNPEASHNLVATTIDCTPAGGPVDYCTTAAPPVITSISDKRLNYASTGFSLDLWGYVSSTTYSISQLTITASTTGSSAVCTLDQNRYLNCRQTSTLGDTNVTIAVKDPCNQVTTKTFKVTVYNNAPTVTVPDVTKSCVQDLNKIFDLYTLSYDENVLSATYAITSESNVAVVDCNIVEGHYVSCKVNSCAEASSTIGVSITDQFGLVGTDTFKVTLANVAPTWTTIPARCINSSQTNMFNLKSFATDVEDGNNLSFALTDQNTASGITCSLDANASVSCTLATNKHASNILTFKATDTNGKYATTKTTISSNCFDGNGNDNNDPVDNPIYFEAEDLGVCLEKCTTYGSQLKLTNKSGAYKCFTIAAESTPYNMLNVSVTPNSICLNNNETGYLTLNANTCGAEERPYRVRVYAVDTNIDLWYDFSVGTCAGFDGFQISENDSKVCKGENKTVPVFVRNTTSVQKRVYLNADNGIILPYFDRAYVDLASGEQKQVGLVINAFNLTPSHYNVLLTGDADGYNINKHLDVEVVDCTDIAKRTFALSAPSVCFDVKRGQVFASQFTITRQDDGTAECYYNPKNFFLGVYGMPSMISYDTVSLLANQSKSVTYEVTVPMDTPAGHQFITIMGSDNADYPSFTEQKSVCLNVLGENKGGLSVKTQALDIIWCASEVFELELSNLGDFDANYTLKANDVPTGVTVSFSKSAVLVPKGQSVTVYANVATSPQALIGDNQWFRIDVNGPLAMTARVYFNITERTSFDDLEILSATKTITMQANSSSSFELVVRNGTESTLKNIQVRVDGIPVHVTADAITISELAPGAYTTVSGKITAGDVNGVFTPAFTLSAGQLANKQTFSLTIEQNQVSKGITGLFMGLFSLGGGSGSSLLGVIVGSILLVIILIVLVAVIIKIITPRSAKKEAWMNHEEA